MPSVFKHYKIVVLTGAGISAASGLKTFRGSDGLWENHRVEDVATPEAFHSNPELVQRFYRLRREQLLSPSVSPNPAHYALAEYQKQNPGKLLIITQNVDNLHERAGSSDVWHMHGELLKARCQKCHTIQDIDIEMPQHCGLLMRPHIVWFGEVPFALDEIAVTLEHCEYFLSIGTSGLVYPAAGFVQLAKSYGIARTVEFNTESTETAHWFDEHVIGPSAQTLPEWLKKIT